MALKWNPLRNFSDAPNVKQTNDFLKRTAGKVNELEATPPATTYPLIFAKVSLGTNQSIPTAPTFTTIAFDTVIMDEESLWNSTDKAFVVPAGYTKMLIQSEVAFWPGTGTRQAVVRKNGASFAGEPSFYIAAADLDITRMTFSGMLEVTEGEKYSIQVYHSAGSNIDIGATSTWFSVTLFPAGMPGIKGDKGEKGDTGDTGDKGDKGDTGEVTQAEFDTHLNDYATVVERLDNIMAFNGAVLDGGLFTENDGVDIDGGVF